MSTSLSHVLPDGRRARKTEEDQIASWRAAPSRIARGATEEPNRDDEAVPGSVGALLRSHKPSSEWVETHQPVSEGRFGPLPHDRSGSLSTPSRPEPRSSGGPSTRSLGPTRPQCQTRVEGAASATSPQLDQSVTSFDHGDDLLEERFEPCDQRRAPGIADPYPHDTRRFTAKGNHVGEVLVLGHDHRAMREGIAPQFAVGRVTRPNVGDMLGDMAASATWPRSANSTASAGGS